MLPSSIQPCSWILLLLLVNSSLLWKNVASFPMCAMRNGRCFMSFEDTFELAGSLSHNISIEVSELFNEFYAALLKSGAMILDAWESPLDDLVSELSTIKNVPDIIISKATDIKKKINAVRNGVNALMSTMLQNGDEEKKNPAWFLQSDNEDARIHSLYGMISCLDNDFKKVDIYLNVLKCYMLKIDNC
ncbi:prolactin-2C3 isoform X2 [Mus musculus]|uniref:prolactin-2C3 isoform X2 n=1 Tax=Mus musculus TaxID=10090 RepID=UPI0000D8B116|nr:prolactin-2C3 isoform X2 [Mus musculus]|eukprot:XP_006516642.1 PREDICTED: prolactin-2C3 isoform X2 [Mus musculus]